MAAGGGGGARRVVRGHESDGCATRDVDDKNSSHVTITP